jgi:hypothetical protein
LLVVTRSIALLFAISCAAALTACSLLPASSPAVAPHIPDAAGVVKHRELVGKNLVFTSEGGVGFTFLANADCQGGSAPTEGDLLVSGVRGERWVYRVMLRPSDATLVPAGRYAKFGPAQQDSTQVLQTVGDPNGDVIMVFPKTADRNDEGTVEGTDDLAGRANCIKVQV